MDLPVNGFKRALLTGKPQIGLWLGLGSAITTELCAAADFDWLLLDAEHGPNDVLSILAQLQAVAPYRSQPVVRPPTDDSVLIKRYLDVGAQTLLIPMVETGEQAEALASAIEYGPKGLRGVATGTRAARWGRVSDYLKRAREEICLVVQIETARGVENVDDIAGAEGVDAVFVGPSDLSAALGFPGQPAHPEVLSTIHMLIDRIHAAGKPVGIFCPDETLARDYIERGCAFVAVGVDAALLARAADGLRERFQPR